MRSLDTLRLRWIITAGNALRRGSDRILTILPHGGESIPDARHQRPLRQDYNYSKNPTAVAQCNFGKALSMTPGS